MRNITDVDDDILRKARELGVHYLDLAAGEIARFDADMAALGLLPAYSEPRATSAIPDILGFIGMVLDRGHAYRAGGAVYFDVSSFPLFGQISHLERDEMIELAAQRGGRPEDPFKDDPLDFVLWQPSAAGEPAWESLWGPGRPGWHIECSALAMRELGTTIDLHGGGSDLIFPHHECESAQSEAATGSRFVRHWMHVGMVALAGEKMSKSLGNLVFVHTLLEKGHDPAAIRLALLSQNYRLGWEWQDSVLDKAEDRLDSWRTAGRGEGGLEQVRARLDDDLDTPGAIVAIDEAAGLGHGIDAAAGLLGVALFSDNEGAGSGFGRLSLPIKSSHVLRARGVVQMPTEITVLSPDGSPRVVPAGTTIADLAFMIGRRLAAAAVCAELDGALVDLSKVLSDGAKLRIITAATDEGRGCCVTRRAMCWHKQSSACGPGRGTRSGPRSPTASTTTSSCRTAPAFPTRTSSGSTPRCGRSWPSLSLLCARSTPSTRAFRSSQTSPTKKRSSRASPRRPLD